jgi:hypothetical protein
MGPLRLCHEDFWPDGAAVTPRNSNLAKDFLGGLFAAALMVAAGTAAAQNAPASTAGAATAPQATAPATPQAAAPTTPAPATTPAQSGFILPPQPPPPAASASDDKKGFDLGQWWDDSVANFKAKMKEQQSKLDDFNKQSADAAKGAASATSDAMKSAATATSDAMKGAADALVHFSTSKVIEVQETCPLAGNGAADCATAATNACKSKGYNSGQPLDVRTAEKCNASLWVSGQPAPTSCPEETVVLRVACQ